MMNVYDFDYFKTRKEVKETINKKKRIYEIYLTTVKFVHKHSQSTYHYPVEYLTTNEELKKMYNGNEVQFSKAFDDLMHYWGISLGSKEEIFENKAFNKFPTIGHLCSFIEDRIKDS
ncbi:hypothetical protein MUO14_21580 [Halobacillus shinanisalinarum]|uniref:Uncharacterized protein n=1 Tax=Halobacillus shinanisalinarum TaxID=2932258 RepID=A0ABY4GYD5_9BACI|nr:hypothetical protein [Halobacillus shinanisalinarum]UOQ92961.1 hypothetical protein MUO14_21580 [Halobacillus shinanisalinarum]